MDKRNWGQRAMRPPSTRKATARRTVGRVTIGPCNVLRDGRVCEPINHVLVMTAEGRRATTYSACSCGRRFPITKAVRQELEVVIESGGTLDENAESLSLDWFEAILDAELWPSTKKSAGAKLGVAPIGTPALHRPARYLGARGDVVAKFGQHMLGVMAQAGGVGLAANQVAMPVRVLAHNLPRVAPQILMNAEILDTKGSWRYLEGCLSVDIEGTRAYVDRPNRVLVRSYAPDGARVIVSAAELFGRVLQHEIDHLNGIEYVQRLHGQIRDRVYEAMRRAGVDVRFVPPLS
jgi:peptide deformylase